MVMSKKYLMKALTVLRLERFLRPFMASMLSPESVIKIYSERRDRFLENLAEENPRLNLPDLSLKRTLWGLTFASPIMNAAGMDKNFSLYEVFFAQGAGGYLTGTTTANQRKGNTKFGFKRPFVSYPQSGAASNFLGLPNEGDEVISKRILEHLVDYKHGLFPLGVSVMGSPDLEELKKLGNLVGGLKKYSKVADFAELNESCPNTGERPQEIGLKGRLKYIQDNFLAGRERNFPVIVKFSNDTHVEQVPELLDLLFECGFDGVNFGNTSTQYDFHREAIHPKEMRTYNKFVELFGGGVSGRPLKETSLKLCAEAVRHKELNGPIREFHIFRCGGIENGWDLRASDDNGISMNQWFTGYLAAFAKHGHKVYERLYEDYLN